MFRPKFVMLPMLLWAGMASAQTATLPDAPATSNPGAVPADRAAIMHMMVASAHNQLGVLEYCQGKGYIGPDTVAVQQKMLKMLPPTGPEGLDEAEATGKTGTVSIAGAHTTLDEAAKSKNTTVEALCQRMAVALAEAGKSLPQ